MLEVGSKEKKNTQNSRIGALDSSMEAPLRQNDENWSHMR